MYLEKLEIQGFKSFAHKNLLKFPGMLDETKRGITAIVGPNGSGKSNIADAIRWVLGEQSMKVLRGKKSEDIIFFGSSKLNKLGMSEVSLFLNNEDHKASIDYTQLVLTRRVYRDGLSEYSLNNSRVRLADIQMLLAKSKFGQKTYSVIGQGMVEGFLNTSLADRKEFFDEATGVKQYQIKRDDSLNKLRSSYENLNQVQMLLTEIEPRLKSLTRQVNKLKKRGEIESQLQELQLQYYGKIWHELNDKFTELNKRFLEIDKIKLEKDKKLDNLNRKLNQLEAQNKTSEEFLKWQNELMNLQNGKDQLTKQLAKLDAQLEIKMEANGQFDLSWLTGKKEEYEIKIKTINKEINDSEIILNQETNKQNEYRSKKEAIDKEINNLNKKFYNYAPNLDKVESGALDRKIKNILNKIDIINNEKNINKIIEINIEIKKELKYILEILKKYSDKENLDEAQDNFKKLITEKEELLIKINERNVYLSAKGERIRMLKEKKDELSRELGNIENKLKRHGSGYAAGSAGKDRDKLKLSLSRIEDQFIGLKEKIGQQSRKEGEERAFFFELQKKVRNLQNEINSHNNNLNEIKVNSTRYETKLEGLEAEIRHSYGSLKKIKANRMAGQINVDELFAGINNLKRQLDQIGGIDPEIEKEYMETKERFDFLSGQVNDLASAISSLEKIIKDLDLIIKERFDKEFELIQEKFEEYFKILFDGGNAKVIKVLAEEEDDSAITSSEFLTGKKDQGQTVEQSLEKAVGENNAKADDIGIKKIKFLQKHNATGLAGIEIKATPPGKKIKNISMLSGGERALTAIALICAIISANPSPFVVLDEVDAALDEANSERLARILEDLSHKTQFIVITHNRATMRRANILYGVTMQDNGISKLISIKLDEAGEKEEVRSKWL